MSAPNSLFVRAAKAQPTERTPVWFMRQAGRYMPEYRAVRKQYSLIEICKKPEVAAQVTIEAAEILKVDAAIIFADLLLPLEVMGLPFHFAAGEGPKIEKPVRTAEDIARLRTDRAADLGYVSEAVMLVCKHFGDKLPVIGFCGAPFTLASYMIEGGGSRNYLFTKKMMYSAPAAWNELMKKLVAVTAEMEEPRFQGRRAGQSRSRAALRRLERTQEASRRYSAPSRRTPRPHLQSRPRHSSRNSGGQRKGALRFHPRALGRVQDGAEDGEDRVIW
jgi:hypothetical protein